MEAKQLSQAVLQKANELKCLCEGLDDRTASSAPAGRWSPRQIISHLSGPDGIGLVPALQAFLEQETPQLNLDPGNPFLSERRERMTFAELTLEFEREYKGIAGLLGSLSEQQLNRKAHIPMLKDMPMGEYPTLGQFTEAIIEHHMAYHIDHMRDILEGLGVKGCRAG